MQIVDGVHLVEDTCNVYVIVVDRRAVLIDFGSGIALDRLAEFGADRVTDVLLTHHHRDQLQGIARAVEHGARVWAPPVERDLISNVDEHWQGRAIDNYYDLRQDRFSLLESVPVTGTVAEYRTKAYGPLAVTAIPTPGHTLGSVSYLVDIAGRRLAFTGDLIYGPGQLWSLSATQWSYSDLEGLRATALSIWELSEHRPDLVLPSHGRPIDDPPAAFTLLESRLRSLIDSRRAEPWNGKALRDKPFQVISPHLLRNVTSFATTYALLSDSGNALFLDFGYDMIAGMPVGDDRSSRRPWLPSLRALKRDHGIDRVEVAVATHYHDDHVAGFNLLRDVEGTQIWAEQSIAPILQAPLRHDLPCLWYDPIGVDRVIEAGRPVRWQEYELTMFPLPGHTLYAVAIAMQVDGQHVLATGDQQDGGWFENGGATEILNFQYKNRFQLGDFVASAQLYRRLRPELMISGHWAPRRVRDDYLDMLLEKAYDLDRMHRDLLPLSDVDFGAAGFGARITPYRTTASRHTPLRIDVEAVNPFDSTQPVAVDLVVPAGWTVTPVLARAQVPAKASVTLTFDVHVADGPRRRARIAADLTVGTRRFGQHAEALIDVE